jgi:hypothetical protein
MYTAHKIINIRLPLSYTCLENKLFRVWNVIWPQVFKSRCYILASCCTILFNGHWRLCLRLRETLLCWFPLSFTTCFGLHGHLQVCRIHRIFIFKCLRILLRCFFSLLPFFYVVTLCTFSICVLFLCCFPSCFLAFSCLCVCLLALYRTPKKQ